MAKKELDEDLLTGGSLSTDKDKQAKKAEKLANKKAKEREKNEAKRTSIKAEIDSLKEAKAKETDEKEVAKLDAKIKKLSDKYSAVGGNTTGGVPKQTAKIIKSVVCIVVIVALLVTYVATGTVRKGFVSSLSLPAQTLTGLTVSNGDNKAKIKVSTYNFYYASLYNNLQSQQSTYENYGIDLAQIGLDVDFDEKLSKQTYTDSDTGETMTWEKHLHNLVLDSIESTYTYYLAAVEANGGEDPEITEDQQSELDETISSYRETANGYGYTLSGYLVRAMGKGVTESVFRRETTRQYIAQNYEDNMSTTLIEAGYSDDDLNAYKDEHEEDLETVDIRIFECDSEDDAKAFASQLESDGSNFADLCVEYSSDEYYQTVYADDGYSTEYGMTRSALQNRGYAIATADATDDTDEDDTDEDTETEETYSGLDWLFSSDRKAGDYYQYSTTVVYILSPAEISDRNTVNVRHILIVPETDDDSSDLTTATDEQWSAAYDQAKEILDSWDGTEDGFATLATENSTDTSSSDNGGLYEDVITGQMVNSFSTWCFDSSRKAGDTAIIRSDYGYHIMYFVGTNDQKIWQYTAEQTLASEDSTTASEELEEEYTIKENWFGSRYFEKDVDISS
jgi:parvulin-like peptidyl-prolyl isomerase